MGERRLAEKVVVKAVATACRETIDTMVEPADEAMRVQTPEGVFSAALGRARQRHGAGSTGVLRQVPGDKRPVRGLARELPAELHQPQRARAC